MGKKKRDAGSPSGGGGEQDFGATYFPFLGPSSPDIHGTSFNFHDGRQAAMSGSGVATDRLGPNRRDAESLHSSPSEAADDNVVSVPMRPIPFPETRSVVLVASPYSPLYPPGFSPLAPPVVPLARSPSTDSFMKRKPSGYQHMQHMGLKHVVIFMAGLFLIALVAVIFTAVYFGQKLDTDSTD